MDTDKEILLKAQPYLRTALAFILYLRFGPGESKDDCYKAANLFLDRLYKDVKSQ